MKNKRFNRKQRAAIIVFFSALFLVHYTFYVPTGLKWKSDRPVVRFVYDQNLSSYLVIDANTIDTMFERLATGIFRDGHSSIGVGNDGAAQTSLSGLEGLACNGMAIPHGSANITIEREADPDCTSSACTFVWDCDGKALVHGDVELNFFDWYRDTSDPEQTDLQQDVLHSFGHLAGLDHCSPGMTEAQCLASLPSGGSNPAAGSVMTAFPETRPLALAEDDRLGLQSLYGALKLPFPDQGPYAVTPGEIREMVQMMDLETMVGLTGVSGRKNLGRYFSSLADYNYYKTRKSLQAQADAFYEQTERQTDRFGIEDLRVQEQILATALYTASRLKEDIAAGRLSMDPVFLDSVIQRHLHLREKTIDRIRSLGYEPE